MRKGIIDRFEGDYAVIEFDGQTEDVLRSELPSEVRSGDVIIFDGENTYISKEETDKRTKEINALMDELFEE